MANMSIRKRPAGDAALAKVDQTSKKQKRQTGAAADKRSNKAEADFIDNDDSDDLENALVDDGATSEEEEADSDASDEVPRIKSRVKGGKRGKGENEDDAAEEVEDEGADGDGDDSFSSDGDDNDDDVNDNGETSRPTARSSSKRNDADAFATSLHKILGTKLSTTRRVDPVLARSAEARESSRRVLDAALEEKARRQMRLEKRAALERGRVKDVLGVGSSVATTGAAAEGAVEEQSTTSVIEHERKLRKVAQRGVVRLFNAVRMAQVKAAETKKVVMGGVAAKTSATAAVSSGIIGMDKREAKVTEMSRKGFLDLIASGGGGLKKGPLEEA